MFYVKWEDNGLDEYIKYARFSKKTNAYVLLNKHSKTALKVIKACVVGENTNIVTDVLEKKQKFLSYNHDLKPVEKWTLLQFMEHDPHILNILIKGSYIEEDDVWIPTKWCWYNLFDKFHNLTLVEVNDEICVELKEWVEKTTNLLDKFGEDYMEMFEHKNGPGVTDVEISNDDVYVKVKYILRYKYQ